MQIGRGIYHTPGAINAVSQGKEWDKEKKTWIIYDLKQEADKVLAINDEEYLASLLNGAYSLHQRLFQLILHSSC